MLARNTAAQTDAAPRQLVQVQAGVCMCHAACVVWLAPRGCLRGLALRAEVGAAACMPHTCALAPCSLPSPSPIQPSESLHLGHGMCPALCASSSSPLIPTFAPPPHTHPHEKDRAPPGYLPRARLTCPRCTAACCACGLPQRPRGQCAQPAVAVAQGADGLRGIGSSWGEASSGGKAEGGGMQELDGKGWCWCREAPNTMRCAMHSRVTHGTHSKLIKGWQPRQGRRPTWQLLPRPPQGQVRTPQPHPPPHLWLRVDVGVVADAVAPAAAGPSRHPSEELNEQASKQAGGAPGESDPRAGWAAGRPHKLLQDNGSPAPCSPSKPPHRHRPNRRGHRTAPPWPLPAPAAAPTSR